MPKKTLNSQNSAERIAAWLANQFASHAGSPWPWVTLTYAQSLDGSLAGPGGVQTILSGAQSMQITHHMRTLHAAILVGIGTIIADNPRLTARLAAGPSPMPVILDSHLRCPNDAALFQHPLQPHIACLETANPDRQAALEAAGAQVWRLPAAANGRVDLAALLDRLHQKGVPSLMVEGGAGVITAFLEAGLANGVVLTIAPRFISGLPALNARLAANIEIYEPAWGQAGVDGLVWGQLRSR